MRSWETSFWRSWSFDKANGAIWVEAEWVLVEENATVTMTDRILISITDSGNSPIARDAHAVLTARSDMASFIDSLVAPLSIINALLAAVAQKKQAELSATLSKLETVWDTFNVYDKNTAASARKHSDE